MAPRTPCLRCENNNSIFRHRFFLPFEKIFLNGNFSRLENVEKTSPLIETANIVQIGSNKSEKIHFLALILLRHCAAGIFSCKRRDV